MKKNIFLLFILTTCMFISCKETDDATFTYIDPYEGYYKVSPKEVGNLKIKMAYRLERETRTVRTNKKETTTKTYRIKDAVYIDAKSAEDTPFSDGVLSYNGRTVKTSSTLPIEYVGGFEDPNNRIFEYQFSWKDDTAQHFAKWKIKTIIQDKIGEPEFKDETILDTAWYELY